jgi:membrane protease YdiL (CAAX protease family)
MLTIFRNVYLYVFVLVYVLSVSILHFEFQQPVSDSLPLALVFGVCFPLISWSLVRNYSPYRQDRAAFPGEIFIIFSLVLFVVWYIAYGTGWMNRLASKSILETPWKNSIFVLCKKLSVFVILPFLIYYAFGFRLNDFGFSIFRAGKKPGRTLLIFIVLSVCILIFQLVAGRGADAFRKGAFTPSQLLYGFPLCFIWYLIEVGLVEEFFFRALLQSRLSILLRSTTGGILISGLIFGLAHAPGLYLRGAASEGIHEQLPFIFWAAYTATVMSLAGIFLGIVWSRTKNIYLVMAIHAIVDLLPNLGDFIRDWHLV